MKIKSFVLFASLIGTIGCATLKQEPEVFRGQVTQGMRGKAPLTKKASIKLPVANLESGVKAAGLNFDPNAVYIFQADPVYADYEVSGRTIKDIGSDLDQGFRKPGFLKGAQRSGSDSELSFQYQVVCGKGQACNASNVASCKLQNVQVWSRITTSLPRLAAGSVCPYAAGVWSQFAAGIKDHEAGHLTNLEQTTLEFGKGLVGLTNDKVFRSCGQIETAIQDLYAIQKLRLAERDLEYDIRTGRGELAGACFGVHCAGYDSNQDLSCR